MSRKTSTPLLDQLGTHTRAIATANQRARTIELEHRNAQTQAEQLRDGRIQALATGDDDLAERLGAERVEAERAARDLADRVAAAQLAVQRAQAHRQQFVTGTLGALLAEHRREAQNAVDAVTDALDALHAAQARWHQAEARTVELLRLAGRGHERTPQFPTDLADAIRRLDKAHGAVPAPLPHEQARTVSIAPEREAARAKAAAR